MLFSFGQHHQTSAMTDVKENKKLLKSKNTVDETPNLPLCCLNFVQARTHTHTEVIPNVAFYHIKLLWQQVFLVIFCLWQKQAHLSAVEGSSGAAGSGGCRCEGSGSPDVPEVLLKWAEVCPCRTDGSHPRILRSGSSCTDEQAEILSGQAEWRKRRFNIINTKY